MHSVKISAVKIWRFRASVCYFVRPSKGLKSHSDELGLETPAGNQLSWVLLYIYSNREVSIFSPYSINNKYIQWHFCRTSLITSTQQYLPSSLPIFRNVPDVPSSRIAPAVTCNQMPCSSEPCALLCIHIWAGNSLVLALITNNLHKKWHNILHIWFPPQSECAVLTEKPACEIIRTSCWN